jgi:lipoate-protein ligase A
MAVDEALLLHAGDGRPTIRLYGFHPAAVSVGRLQRALDLPDGTPGVFRPEGLAALRRDGLDLVRRPTGGQAVLHDHELTYAVVLGRRHFQPFGKRDIYRFVAGLLLRGLKQLGVGGQSARARRGSLREPDCFQATGEYEIASEEQRKLVGSAQMLTREGSLQHGAIPLDGSYRRIADYLWPSGLARPRRGQPSSIGEELGRRVDFDEAREAFAAGFTAALREQGVDLQPGEASDAERSTAEELLSRRYSQDSWNLVY